MPAPKKNKQKNRKHRKKQRKQELSKQQELVTQQLTASEKNKDNDLEVVFISETYGEDDDLANQFKDVFSSFTPAEALQSAVCVLLSYQSPFKFFRAKQAKTIKIIKHAIFPLSFFFFSLFLSH
ncbi:hypothetical protein RFI_21397 [Reticulomyxa filosa]|uniref:Uncharacterized protein n=1 Tax=Reticulomyxa filosa TaxID=46433 RepID=X6MRB0_RETFI|nr:hypothetical protein RFI_21397 [Reticulomyxa filosa]|eukprot:ETO15962.1 hypothetical protein RFI_21397 [Reticulomyxa filosa]